MARKPITTYAGGKGPRQLVWEAIRKLAAGDNVFDEFTIWRNIATDVSAGIELSTVRDYRYCLVAAGILEVVCPSLKRHTPATYRLAKDEGLDAPRFRRDGTRVTQGLAQEQMWRTLRMLDGDTNTRELVAHASTAATPIATSTANDYLQVLYYAGYLVRTSEGHGTGCGGIQARYKLKPSRNTGPRPPMVCRTKIVYDPNEDKIVWQPRVTEEEAIYGR